MKKESLEKISNEIIKLLSNSKITPEDRVELMINILHFLEPKEYEDNIRTLQSKKH